MEILARQTDAAKTIIAISHILAHHQKSAAGAIGTQHAIGKAMTADALGTVCQVGGVLTFRAVRAFVAAVAFLTENAIGATGAIRQIVAPIIYRIRLKLVFQFFESFFEFFYIHQITSRSVQFEPNGVLGFLASGSRRYSGSLAAVLTGPCFL